MDDASWDDIDMSGFDEGPANQTFIINDVPATQHSLGDLQRFLCMDDFPESPAMPRSNSLKTLNSPLLLTQPSASPSNVHTTSHTPLLPSSPVPSSAASLIASECEDEGFDDILFPDVMDEHSFPVLKQLKASGSHNALNRLDEDPLPSLKASKESVPSYLAVHMEQDSHAKAEEDAFNDIDLPSTISLHDKFKDFQYAKFNTSPSKIPRLVTNRSNNSLASSVNASPVKMSRSCSLVTPMTRAKTVDDYGDGSELLDIDDLEVHEASERRFLSRNNSVRVPSAPVAKHTSSSSSVPQHTTGSQHMARSMLARSFGSSCRMRAEDHRESRFNPQAKHESNLSRRMPVGPTHHKKLKKKPTLIRNLNQPEVAKVVGDMTYNPTLQKWEGNESVLQEFDKHLAPAKTARPCLITNMSGSKNVAQVGEMTFDPVRMCWVGNEDELDVFGEIEESAPGRKDMSTPKQHTEFMLDNKLKESIYISESSHKLFVGKWYPRAVLDSRTMFRDTSKTHLYEIRHLL